MCTNKTQIISFCNDVCYAENYFENTNDDKTKKDEEIEKEINEKIDDVLDKIDSSELDDYIKTKDKWYLKNLKKLI